MSDIIPEPDRKLVDDAVAKLLEQFDSVRIFVTRHDGNGSETAAFDTGGGNVYAQLGQIKEWVILQDQYAKNHAIRKDQEEE